MEKCSEVRKHPQRIHELNKRKEPLNSLFHAGVCVQRHTSSEHNPQSTTGRGPKAFTLKVDTGLQRSSSSASYGQVTTGHRALASTEVLDHVKINNKWSHTSSEHNPQSCRLQHWYRHPRNFSIAHFHDPTDRHTCRVNSKFTYQLAKPS